MLSVLPTWAGLTNMRKISRCYLPNNESFKKHPNPRGIKQLLEDPKHWRLNRRPVSKAFVAGLFATWILSLGLLFMAAAGAIWFRANLPISALLLAFGNRSMEPALFNPQTADALILTGIGIDVFYRAGIALDRSRAIESRLKRRTGSIRRRIVHLRGEGRYPCAWRVIHRGSRLKSWFRAHG